MSDVQNHKHTKSLRGARALGALRVAAAVLATVAAVVLVVYAIFHDYSNKLSDEFYLLTSDSMNDYTAAQKVEV